MSAEFVFSYLNIQAIGIKSEPERRFSKKFVAPVPPQCVPNVAIAGRPGEPQRLVKGLCCSVEIGSQGQRMGRQVFGRGKTAGLEGGQRALEAQDGNEVNQCGGSSIRQS